MRPPCGGPRAVREPPALPTTAITCPPSASTHAGRRTMHRARVGLARLGERPEGRGAACAAVAATQHAAWQRCDGRERVFPPRPRAPWPCSARIDPAQAGARRRVRAAVAAPSATSALRGARLDQSCLQPRPPPLALTPRQRSLQGRCKIGTALSELASVSPPRPAPPRHSALGHTSLDCMDGSPE